MKLTREVNRNLDRDAKSKKILFLDDGPDFVTLAFATSVDMLVVIDNARHLLELLILWNFNLEDIPNIVTVCRTNNMF